MRLLVSRRGIALITTLIVALIGLALISAVTHLIVTSSRTSGTVRRYTTALEAVKGGIEEFVEIVASSSWSSPPTDSHWVSGHDCKLRRDTIHWTTVCSSICTEDSCTSHAKPDDIKDHADWINNYGSYNVYTKIIDCKGYADGWLFTIEAVAEQTSGNEEAWVSVLYQIE